MPSSPLARSIDTEPARSTQAPPPWRFVLVVGSAQRSPGQPLVLEPVLVRALGRGATLLKEPFEPTVKIRFDWPAPSQTEAVAAAIREVESCALRVLRVDNDDWVTAADIALRIDRSREAVRTWAAGRYGPGGFPPPVNPRRETTFYSWAEVLPWLRDVKGLDLPDEEPGREAANMAVQLRALLCRLPQPQAILDLLHSPGVPAPVPGRQARRLVRAER